MWGRAVPAAALVLVNALVFGLIHVNNVDGHWLLTLSYAGAGLVMNLVYLWTRNIWHVLLMHALNNFLLGGPLTVLLVKLLSDAVAGAARPVRLRHGGPGDAADPGPGPRPRGGPTVDDAARPRDPRRARERAAPLRRGQGRAASFASSRSRSRTSWRRP